jgi:hypothetical protein
MNIVNYDVVNVCIYNEYSIYSDKIPDQVTFPRPVPCVLSVRASGLTNVMVLEIVVMIEIQCTFSCDYVFIHFARLPICDFGFLRLVYRIFPLTGSRVH